MKNSFAIPLLAAWARTGNNEGSNKFLLAPVVPDTLLPLAGRQEAGVSRDPRSATWAEQAVLLPEHGSAAPANYSRSAQRYTSLEQQTGKRSTHRACLYKEIRIGCT